MLPWLVVMSLPVSSTAAGVATCASHVALFQPIAAWMSPLVTVTAPAASAVAALAEPAVAIRPVRAVAAMAAILKVRFMVVVCSSSVFRTFGCPVGCRRRMQRHRRAIVFPSLFYRDQSPGLRYHQSY